MGLQGFQFVIYPDVDSHEKGLCVKMVKGVLTILPHGTPSFFTPRGSRSSSTRRNFSQGLFLTGFLPALLFGVPVLLLNALRYFAFGFALSPALLGNAFLFHLPTLVLELQAYILVTFGGLVLLAKTLRREGYRSGLRGLLLAFYLGALFLLAAAWYEAWEVVFLL
ncbi:hypothetical protein TTMY_1347 [Thermus thermophilus]|nr:hypothetical protein TTMY_1347 [Thermus thermophilus]